MCIDAHMAKPPEARMDHSNHIINLAPAYVTMLVLYGIIVHSDRVAKFTVINFIAYNMRSIIVISMHCAVHVFVV